MPEDNKMTSTDSLADIEVVKKIDKEAIKSQIFEIRGFRVMIDSDIAKYFGVETKALNRAMKRNIKRFPENFCFKLTSEECSRCQIGTLNGGRGSNIKYFPYAYTEQGVAMLTSCLHTDRAISASIQIMEAFVEMTHYLQQSRQLLQYQELHVIANKQKMLESEVDTIKKNMVTRADLSDFMKLFDNSKNTEEILILDGQPFKADVAYQKIYRKAKKSIIVIDDYIGVKTLRHLAAAKRNIDITIISDNKGRQPLRQSEYDDFAIEYPDKDISFIKTENKTHDRYIVLDNGTKDMKVYLCGSSSKDSGKKITTIMQVSDIAEYKEMVKKLLVNPKLTLK